MALARTLRWLFPVTLCAAAYGCVGADVTTLRAMPSKPEGCPVEIFPSTSPSYPWVDVATVEAKCHFTSGRSACIERLKQETCAAGGDTLYALKDGRQGEQIIVIATVAARRTDVSASPPVALTEEPSQTCDPPCSPGYKCAGTVCEPQCNPTCESGFTCARDRTCKPVAAAASSATPAAN